MSNQNQEGCGIWGVMALILVVFTTILSALGPSNSTPADNKYRPADTDERLQHEYAKQRIKLEGYSDADAATAADAIMKFQRAQQNRK